MIKKISESNITFVKKYRFTRMFIHIFYNIFSSLCLCDKFFLATAREDCVGGI